FNPSDAIAAASSLSSKARVMTNELDAFFGERMGVTTESKTPIRPAVLIPNHNHRDTIEALLDKLAPHQIDCLLVDDGSGPETQRVLQAAATKRDWVQLLRRPQRGGKGAAVMDGLRSL